MAGHESTDPVCGMQVAPGNEAERIEHDGTEYLFCSTGCAKRFRAEPLRYTKSQATMSSSSEQSCCEGHGAQRSSAPPPDSAGAIYTCPMHPEVRRVGPGDCPKCGMALERADATAEQDDSELRDMTRRLWVATAFTAPLLVYVMGSMFIGSSFEGLVSPTVGQWVELGLATPVVLWCAWPFFVRGLRSILAVRPNMWTLISIGVERRAIPDMANSLSVLPASIVSR